MNLYRYALSTARRRKSGWQTRSFALCIGPASGDRSRAMIIRPASDSLSFFDGHRLKTLPSRLASLPWHPFRDRPTDGEHRLERTSNPTCGNDEGPGRAGQMACAVPRHPRSYFICNAGLT